MKRMFLIALVIFVADQLSKLWVLQVIDLDSRGDTDVFPPYLVLRMAWNEGINFGLIDGASKWVLIAIAILITGWVIWWMSKEKRVLAHISGCALWGSGGFSKHVMLRIRKSVFVQHCRYRDFYRRIRADIVYRRKEVW